MADALPPRRPVADLLRDFLRQETTASVLLLAVTVAALVWANSPAGDTYRNLWHRGLTLGWGSWSVSEDLIGWVSDGLMAVFFFVVGLEIKRELVVGELRTVKAALLPAAAALGGAVLPALLFLVIAPGGPAARGWGVPMATDIAFAVGVLALVGRRTTRGAKLFLLSLAIVDDLIVIVVIAVFYSGDIAWRWLAFAAIGVLAILGMRRTVSSPWAYVIPALVVWVGLLESGIHATLAGVLLGLLTPGHPVRGRPVLAQLEHRLHPVSAYVIIPLFALANAGVDLRHGALGHALGQRVTWAVVVGLVVGKTVGISATTLFLVRRRIGTLPMGMRRSEVLPVSALGGIGFTVALFVAGLAYTDATQATDAKVGIFIGSLAAGALGTVLLGRRVDRSQPR